MIKLEVEVEGDFVDIQKNIQNALQTEVYPFFRRWAKAIAEEEVKKRKGLTYAVAVDGYLVPSLDSISLATREVQVVWVQEIVKLAVAEYSNILQRSAVNRAASGRYWDQSKRDQIPKSIKVFYGGRKRVTREITSVNDISEFGVDDFIMITSSSPWQQYLNTKGKKDKSHRVKPLTQDLPGHKGGYFGLAARRIKNLLGANRKTASAVWVGAVRSRAVLEAIGMPPLKTPEGQANWIRLQSWGAWAILIKLSSKQNAKRALLNG